MKESRVIGLDAYKQSLRKELFGYLAEEQTNRLIAYAKDKIVSLGNKIQTYNSRNHMDRTGNLLNSLCWGVAYNGELKDFGFYREANSLQESHMHEWMGGEQEAYPVNGHALAEGYIQRYGKLSGRNMWRSFFAILAPYWGYWEEGFRMVSGGGRSTSPRSERFLQFSVMSEFYDEAKQDLKPANVKLKVYVEKYVKPYNIGSYRYPGSLRKDFERRVNNPYGKYGHDKPRIKKQ